MMITGQDEDGTFGGGGTKDRGRYDREGNEDIGLCSLSCFVD